MILSKRIQRDYLDDLMWADEVEEIGMLVFAKAIRKTVQKEIYQYLRATGLPTKAARIQTSQVYQALVEKARE